MTLRSTSLLFSHVSRRLSLRLDFIVIFISFLDNKYLQDEEEKLVARLEKHRRVTTASIMSSSSAQSCMKEETLSESDVVLCKLFLSPKVNALSPGIQFDPSIR